MKLNETSIEFGNGKAYAVSNSVNPMYSQNKLGAKAKSYTKTTDVRNLSPLTREMVGKIVDYLKKKGLFDKVGKELNFDTTDAVFKANGDCVINFDEGGSTVIPAYVFSKPKQLKEDVKNKYKRVLKEGVIDFQRIREQRRQQQEEAVIDKIVDYLKSKGLLGVANTILTGDFDADFKANGDFLVKDNNGNKLVIPAYLFKGFPFPKGMLKEDVVSNPNEKLANKSTKIKKAIRKAILIAAAAGALIPGIKSGIQNVKDQEFSRGVLKAGQEYNDEKTNQENQKKKEELAKKLREKGLKIKNGIFGESYFNY